MKKIDEDGCWLPALVEDHLGIYRTGKGIELLTFGPGTLYLYCRYPGLPAARRHVQLVLCREYATFGEFQERFAINKPSDLEALTPAGLVPKYDAGELWISGYIGEPSPCLLVFELQADGTLVTDQETDRIFTIQRRLEDPALVIQFTRDYAEGHGGHLFPVPPGSRGIHKTLYG